MKKSYLIAIGVTALIVIWMGAGIVFNDGRPEAVASLNTQEETSDQITVEVREQDAVSTVSYVVAQGNIMPDREVVIRAETAGQIKDIVITEGHAVKEKDVLASIDLDDRSIRLERAKAQVSVEGRKYNSLKNLGTKGYTAQTRIDEALATYKQAQADEKQIKLDIAHTKIKAPFDGVIDEQSIEKGDYVEIGNALFTLVDNNPLVATVYVPQKDVNALKAGGEANVTLATGEEAQGRIRFIAPRAHQETRSFRVEVEIPNPDNLPSGTTAIVQIPKESVMAHFISPALLTLNNEGTAGVKTVDDAGHVLFHPIQIVASEQTGIYVTGLPDKAQIIVNGQGFVRTGDTVSFVQSDVAEDQNAENN